MEAPIAAAEFAALMAPFEPFEPKPHVAVAVSGGADSLALSLLAHDWARTRGGAITALTVDHGLRAESAAEAAKVGNWLAARGIAHHVLRWSGPRAARGVQAAARSARYRLLEAWCAEAGVFHLLLAHHLDDQAETVLLRLARGSGLDGLAGMAAMLEHAPCRLLRPFLDVPRPRLAATLESAGQSWIDDPSNRDAAYARARLRRDMPALAAHGLTALRLARTAARLAGTRRAIEADVAALLARAASIHPAGFAWLDGQSIAAAPEEFGLRALAALVTMIGGAEYPPRSERLARLHGELSRGLAKGRTLGGCRILPRRPAVLICREPAALAPPVPVPPSGRVAWDGRFRLTVPSRAPAGLTLGALGTAPLDVPMDGVPKAARPGLPALRRGNAVVAVPPLGYVAAGFDGRWLAPGMLVLRPTRPLTGAGFTVV